MAKEKQSLEQRKLEVMRRIEAGESIGEACRAVGVGRTAYWRWRQKSRGAGELVLSFRFRDAEHHDLVREAARRAGLSLNGWIRKVTLQQASKELAA